MLFRTTRLGAMGALLLSMAGYAASSAILNPLKGPPGRHMSEGNIRDRAVMRRLEMTGKIDGRFDHDRFEKAKLDRAQMRQQPALFTTNAAMASAEASLAMTPPKGTMNTKWVALGPGSTGGRIRSILIHPTMPDTMWVGSVGGGVWRTFNGGTTWTPMDDFMGALAIGSMAIDPKDPKILYAGTGEGFGNGDAVAGAGIYRSSDLGTSWTQILSTKDWRNVNRIAISPTDSRRILAATGDGLFLSTDAGVSWSLKVSSYSLDVRFSPTDGNKAVVAGAGAGSVYFTQDGGTTWTSSTGFILNSSPVGGRIELAYSPSNPAYVYASVDVDGGKVFRSVDGGRTFTLMTAAGTSTTLGQQGWYDNCIWVNPTNANELMSGGTSGWISKDGGATGIDQGYWYIHPDWHAIVAHPKWNGTTNRTVFIGNDGGIYRMDNWGTPTQTTTNLNHNLQITQAYRVGVVAKAGWIAMGTQDNFTNLYHGDKETWTVIGGGDGADCSGDPLPDAQGNYYMYGESQAGGNNYRFSSTLGNESNSSSFGLGDPTGDGAWVTPTVLDTNGGQGGVRLYSGRSAGLWVLANPRTALANQWRLVFSTDLISEVAVKPGNSNEVWFATQQGMFKSPNVLSASPYFTVISGPPAKWCNAVRFDPQNPAKAYAVYGGQTNDNVWKSVDGGATWANIHNNLPAVPVYGIAIHPQNGNLLYVATELGVFASADGGATWSANNEGPADVASHDLIFMGTKLVLGTHGRGVYTLELGTPPGTVAGFVATAGEGRAQLAWTANTQNDHYEIKRGTSATGPFQLVSSNVVGNRFLNDGLANGTTYYYTIQAFNISGAGPVSAPISVKPLAGAGGAPNIVRIQSQLRAGDLSTDALIRPSLRLVNTGTAALDLSKARLRYWFTGDGATGFTATCESAPMGCAKVLLTTGAESPVRTGAARWVEIKFAVDAGTLAAGTTGGEIRLKIARTPAGNFAEAGDYSYVPTLTTWGDNPKTVLWIGSWQSWGITPAGGKVATGNLEIPGAPTGLVATAGIGQVNLAWAAAPRVATYDVYQAEVATGPWTKSAAGLPATQRSLLVTGLTNDKAYFFNVQARNAAGAGPVSAVAKATPTDPRPKAPTNLVYTLGTGNVKLTWDAAPGAVDYVIRRSMYRYGTDQEWVAKTNSVVDMDVRNWSNYSYSVVGRNTYGEGMPGYVSVTIQGKPDTINGFTSRPGDKVVHLRWNGAAAGPTYSYEVQRGTGTPVVWTAIYSGTDYSFDDIGLVNGTDYRYRMRAVNPIGAGDYTSEILARPLAAIAAPQGFKVIPGDQNLFLQWNAVVGAYGYQIYYKGPYAVNWTLKDYYDTIKTNSYNWSFVENAKNYEIKIVALDAQKREGTMSSAVLAVPQAILPAPATVSAVGGLRVADVSWSAVPGATYYAVYGMSGPNRYNVRLGTTTALTYHEANLAGSTKYVYQVVAGNATGEGSKSVSAFATTTGTPEPPGYMSAWGYDQKNTVSWSYVEGATDYSLYFSTTKGGPYQLLQSNLTNTYTNHEPVVNGVTYYYVAIARNSYGESGRSAEGSATPSPKPAAVTSIVATPGDRSISIAWQNVANATSYSVVASLSPDFSTSRYAYGAQSPLVLTGLANGETYYIKVSSQNSAGSTESQVFTAVPGGTILPAKPTGLVATAGDAKISLSWNPSAGATAGYQIMYRIETDPVFAVYNKYPVTATSYTATGLTNGSKYFFYLKALGSGGAVSPNSDEVFATPKAAVSGYCANPVELTGNGSGNFNTTGAVCLKVKTPVGGWGCSNFDGRTVKVNGVSVACAGALPSATADGWYWFDVSAGSITWASLYWW